MNLKLKSISDRGNSQKERVVIRVLEDTNIGFYLVLCTGFSDGSVNTGITETFWFPDIDVRSGDLLVLYSKPGTTSEKQLESGGKAHFFYWGNTQPLWNSNSRGVVLLRGNDWEAAGAGEL